MDSPRTTWPTWATEAFEERAAIHEYDAHLPREDAERKAESAVLVDMAQRAAGKRGS